MTSLSSRMKDLPISSIRKLVPLADEAKKKGVRVFHLNIGQPDVLTPQIMIDSLRNWSENPISYAPSAGTPEYLQALLWYYHGLGHQFLEKKHIISTIAGSEALAIALFGVGDVGDEIIVFEPFYSSYAAIAHMGGLVLKPVKTFLKDGFHLPEQAAIEAAITPKTKAILYSSPANPTGVVYRREEVQLLIDIVQKHNLFLIADEVYREYIFDNSPHASILSHMQSAPQHTVLVDSLSKRYNLCGARLGCVVSLHEEFMSGVMKCAMSRLSAGLIDQYVGSKLTEVPSSYIDKVRSEYKTRRDVLYRELLKIDGVSAYLPEGAFYLMVQLPVEDAEDFCRFLLRDFQDEGETVMFAPGNGFYSDPEHGKNEVRIAYVLEERSLIRSAAILKKALAVYRASSS